MVVLNDRSDFTLDTYRRVAWEGEAVEIAPAALEVMGQRRASMERLVANNPDRHYYGTTTTPGDGVKKVLTPEERRAFLDRGTPGGWTFGDPVPDRVARGFAFTRLINFIEGYSGVRPELAAAIAGYLDGDELGEVPSRGHSWEIAVPGHLYPGLAERVGGFEMGETMALANGCPAGTALVCDLALAGRTRVETALQVTALGAEALLAPPEHYAEEIGELWGDCDEQEAMRRVRELMAGGSAERRPYQAPVSFRIVPRMVGIALRSQRLAEEAAATMLRAVSDNPVYVPPGEGRPDGDIWSTGGYHPAQAIQAMDSLAYAWANLCQLLYHESVRLNEDEYGLRVANPLERGGARQAGAMGAAAWAYDAAQLCTPTLLPLTGSSQTDAGSMAFAAWRKATQIGLGLDAMVGIVAASAVGVFDVTERPVPPALQDLAALVRSHRTLGGPLQTVGAEVGSIAEGITAQVYGVEVAV